MLVVRKEGKEHARYNSFRSAFELLESVGRDPQDCFDERHEDLPPLQKLEQRMTQLQTTQQQTQARIDLLESGGRDPLNCLDEVLLQKMEQRLEKRMQQQIEQLQTSHQQQIEQLQTKQQTQAQQIAKLMLENELLRSTVNDVLK